MAATPAWLAAVEATFNRGIVGSQRASALAQRCSGTSIRLKIEGVTSLRASISGVRLALAGDSGDDAVDHAPADATISGSPLALFRLMRGDSAHGESSAAAQLRGDAEIANAYRQLLTLARPDLEEELARMIGDFPARRFAHLLQHSVAWVRSTTRIAQANVAEYLQEESRDLVGTLEIEEFLQGVDTLRETADRIEARLARLERRVAGAAE